MSSLCYYPQHECVVVVAGGPQYGRFLYFAAADMQLVVLMVKILRVAVDKTSTPPPQILTVGAWMTIQDSTHWIHCS